MASVLWAPRHVPHVPLRPKARHTVAPLALALAFRPQGLRKLSLLRRLCVDVKQVALGLAKACRSVDKKRLDSGLAMVIAIKLLRV